LVSALQITAELTKRLVEGDLSLDFCCFVLALRQTQEPSGPALFASKTSLQEPYQSNAPPTVIGSTDHRKFQTRTGPCCQPQPPAPPPPSRPQPSPAPPQLHTQPSTAPHPNQQYHQNLYILQIIINEIQNKLDKLLHYMEKNKIHIAAIQETKLTSKSKLRSTPNFTLIRNDQDKYKGGVVAFLIHNHIPFHQVRCPTSPSPRGINYL